MSGALAGLIGSVLTVLATVGGWFVTRRIRNAQVNKTDAETRKTNAESSKTEAETWSLLNGGLSARVTALEKENADLRLRLVNADSRFEKATAELRSRLSHAEDRADKAEDEARQCRIDLDDFRRRYELDAPHGGDHE